MSEQNLTLQLQIPHLKHTSGFWGTTKPTKWIWQDLKEQLSILFERNVSLLNLFGRYIVVKGYFTMEKNIINYFIISIRYNWVLLGTFQRSRPIKFMCLYNGLHCQLQVFKMEIVTPHRQTRKITRQLELWGSCRGTTRLGKQHSCKSRNWSAGATRESHSKQMFGQCILKPSKAQLLQTLDNGLSPAASTHLLPCPRPLCLSIIHQQK